MTVELPAPDISTNPDRGGRRDTPTEDPGVEYSIGEIPPIPLLLTSALQVITLQHWENTPYTCTPYFSVTAPPDGASDQSGVLLSDCPTICAPFDSYLRSQLFSAELFMCGISTVLQTFLGVRLPIVQGPSGAFLPTIIALRKNSIWTCEDQGSSDVNATLAGDLNNITQGRLSSEEKLRQLSGSLMAASVVEILVGATGLVGLVMRFVGPITVAATVILLGVSLINIPITYAKASWELALCGAVLAIVFGLYLRHKALPVPTCRKGKGSKSRGLLLFQLFPIILSVGIVWILSAILTATNVFPPDPTHPRYKARTDAKNNLLMMTPWFNVTYPGQFGMPSFNVAIFIGFITAFCASIVESVGDYLATARACHVTAPPNHAVNRGILAEGIGGLLSGTVGVGHATTSLSQNVAVLALSGTCSRVVVLCAGTILILISVVGKLGAAIATIPDPALGGALLVLFGMLVSLGLSNLQHVHLDSSRNVIILGISLFAGILIPEWINTEGGLINTGNKEADSVLKVALGTPMFLGGVISLVLDNTVRENLKERGISHVTADDSSHLMTSSAYTWSCLHTGSPRLAWCSRLPFMPPRNAHVDDEVANTDTYTVTDTHL